MATQGSAFERLHKVLTLEQQQGYRNKAVIGGLDKFAARWQQDAEKEAPPAAVAEIVALLMGYPTLMDVAARERLIGQVIIKAARAVGMSSPAQPSPGDGAPALPKAPETAEATVVMAPVGKGPATSAAPAPRPPRIPSSRAEPLGLEAPVSRLPGVGQAKAEQFAQLGVRTVGDLLFLLPRRYDDYSALKTVSQLSYGEEVTIVVNLWSIKSRRVRDNLVVVEAIFSDSTGTIQVTWFNQEWIVQSMRVGQTYRLSGKVDSYLGRPVMRSPAWEPIDKEVLSTGRIVPVYPLTEGLNATWLRKIMKQVVDAWAPQVPDPLPESVRQRAGLLSLPKALAQAHFPDNHELLAAAQRRMAFDEFFVIQLGALRQRQQWRAQTGRPLTIPPGWLDEFRAALPFSLTRAQERVLGDIAADLARAEPMSRLLQGDVGSGKTVVAAGAMWLAARNGAQAALMAPTQILAEQHYRNLAKLFNALASQGAPAAPRVALLTGNLRESEKEETRRAIAAGEVNIVIGTHALIQQEVSFRDLVLAVVDEQHRFGVEQRAALRQKGHTPHLLAMSATPIPRTLALTLYGDLDLSILDEMPPGRQPIATRWLRPRERERAYAFVRRQVEQGRQAFIICPLIEESEALDAKAAVEEHQRLQREVFPDLKLGLLHGRMKAEEKDEVMQAFSRGELHILVSTAVVEVGIDVPNATVILVEGAERFGLAQLHQFRGRVGRGEHPSYCLLVSEAASGEKVEQLRILEQTQDGFVVAEKDLELRGPGDFFGTRQSGLPELRWAKLSDVRTLELARNEAQRLFALDPELSLPEHQLLARRVAEFWQGRGELS